MRRSLAAWLLVGLSLCVPQLCTGEATGSRPLGAGPAGSALEAPRRGLEAVPPPGGPWVASGAGGAEVAAHPGFPPKSAPEVKASARS